MKSLVQRTLRRRLRSERLYNLARRCMLSWQYLTKTPDDPEFRVFGKAGLGEGDRTEGQGIAQKDVQLREWHRHQPLQRSRGPLT